MKIRFPNITNFSGADVYFERLARGVRQHGWQADLRLYPHLLEFLPCATVRPFLATNGDCDLIHTKAEYGWMFARHDKPLVVTLAHSVFDPEYDRYKNPVKRVYHNLKLRGNIRRSFDTANRIVTISNYSARQIRETWGAVDVHVIHNGIDVNFFCPAEQTLSEPAAKPKGPVRLLFVGNMTARKGFPLLKPILEQLGDGYTLAYTTGLRTKGRAAPHPAMQPLGKLFGEDLVEAYRRCDIFVFPSRLEGFGYPVAEAMACGKPVVTTNCSSLPELVDDEQGGFLCPRDDVNAFAEAIARLGNDPDRQARMGAHNRARAERDFSLERCVRQYVELYEELV